ncbi:uncharacterized protein LOC132743316 [Ruditapes philippinarum]|uniref:uncharacterized protein LOC132743316 n=1 Tax=Ruditapes philippinarum TaxID=129788 RepID=UPI00295BE0C8|nr:uncharacterized protein LOC132743316 [Ruditapes philippinarum]
MRRALPKCSIERLLFLEALPSLPLDIWKSQKRFESRDKKRMADKEITFLVYIDGVQHQITADQSLVEVLNSNDPLTRHHAYEYVATLLKKGNQCTLTKDSSGVSCGIGEPAPMSVASQKELGNQCTLTKDSSGVSCGIGEPAPMSVASQKELGNSSTGAQDFSLGASAVPVPEPQTSQVEQEPLSEKGSPETENFSSSWTRSQSKLLTELYKQNHDKFQNPVIKKRTLWEQITKDKQQGL